MRSFQESTMKNIHEWWSKPLAGVGPHSRHYYCFTCDELRAHCKGICKKCEDKVVDLFSEVVIYEDLDEGRDYELQRISERGTINGCLSADVGPNLSLVGLNG